MTPDCNFHISNRNENMMLTNNNLPSFDAAPKCWDEILGNQGLKKYLQDMIWSIRERGVLTGIRGMVTGPSRSGKTETIRYAAKCIRCEHLDYDTLDACGVCKRCTNLPDNLYGPRWFGESIGIRQIPRPDSVEIQYYAIDCASQFVKTEIENILDHVLWNNWHGLNLFTLDEVHHLSRHNLDDTILKPIEDHSAIWLASTAQLKKSATRKLSTLEKMLQNRFTLLRTEKPSEKELTMQLIERCDSLAINCSDPERVMQRLSQRSHRIVGRALPVLARALNSRERELTIDMVEDYIFDVDEG
jgi:hypothetical protein